jgi:hypothetical protein
MKPDNFKPCSWHVRLLIPQFCSVDCARWRQEVDIRTLGDIAALDNPAPWSEE